MKKSLIFTFAVALLGLVACNSDKKTNKEIDSLNAASADSLLNAALADTTTKADTLKKDSIPK
jgi:hypothetical protein